MDKPKFTRVKSIDHFKKLCSGDSYKDFRIELNFGLFSRYEISYSKEDKKFDVFMSISSDWFSCKEKELNEMTNIPTAIKKKQFCFVKY